MSILNKNVALFYILFQLFITLNSKLALANFNHPQMKFRNPGNHGQGPYTAKQAMDLVTTIDLPTCRCINTFVAGKYYYEVIIIIGIGEF